MNIESIQSLQAVINTLSSEIEGKQAVRQVLQDTISLLQTGYQSDVAKIESEKLAYMATVANEITTLTSKVSELEAVIAQKDVVVETVVTEEPIV